MENTITTTAAQGAAKRNNPIKHFISALNAKRRKAVLSLTTMVTMAMASSVSAFAEGGEGVADGEAAFNSVIGFFATWSTYRSGSRLCRRHYVRPRDQERRRGSKDPRTYDAGVGLCGVRAHAFA